MGEAAEPPTIPEVARHYDLLDGFFREIWGEHVHHGYWRNGEETYHEAVRALTERVAVALELQGGESVCDIGCGYGATARYLVDRYAARVTAITVSHTQAQYAVRQRQGAGGNPLILCEDWLHGPPRAGEFDAALALESAEHMPDLINFFTRAAQALRPGGRLVVAGWQAGAGRGTTLLGPICRAARMPPLLSQEQYVTCAQAAGFHLVNCEDWTRQVGPTWVRMGFVLLQRLLRKPALVGHVVRHWRFGLAAMQITAAFSSGALRYRTMTFTRDIPSR